MAAKGVQLSPARQSEARGRVSLGIELDDAHRVECHICKEGDMARLIHRVPQAHVGETHGTVLCVSLDFIDFLMLKATMTSLLRQYRTSARSLGFLAMKDVNISLEAASADARRGAFSRRKASGTTVSICRAKKNHRQTSVKCCRQYSLLPRPAAAGQTYFSFALSQWDPVSSARPRRMVSAAIN